MMDFVNRYRIISVPDQSAPSSSEVSEPRTDFQRDTFIERVISESSVPKYSPKYNFTSTSTVPLSKSLENIINQKRITDLHRQFTPQLINMILTTDFEYGLDNPIDDFVHDLIVENSFATMIWLNSIFYDYFDKPIILIGILRIISRMSYENAYPLGQTMASFAFLNPNTEVKECGIRAFENWNNLHSLRVLERIDVTPLWLQSYVNQIIESIKKENSVSAI